MSTTYQLKPTFAAIVSPVQGSAIVVRSLNDTTVIFETKKGMKEITAEGACFKGGKALVALRDAAAEAALSKAMNGRYRAAADIVATLLKATEVTGFDKFVMHGKQWGLMNKNDFQRLCAAALLADLPKSGKWNDKQQVSRELAQAYLHAHPLDEGDKKDTIENGDTGTPPAPAQE